MKKFLVSALALFVLGSFGTAFAQAVPTTDTAGHNVDIRIPEVVLIRVVPVDENQAANVVFDFATLAADQATYFAALESATGSDWLGATSHNLADVEVLAVGTSWDVKIAVAGSFANTDFELADVRVSPTGADSVVEFFLDDSDPIADGAATGWTSLGISGDDFALFVDGTENAGSDTITVTYTITNL